MLLMTDAEIDALPAGRELDALVDAAVFGTMQSDGHLIPPYSTAIGAAWLVWERIVADRTNVANCDEWMLSPKWNYSESAHSPVGVEGWRVVEFLPNWDGGEIVTVTLAPTQAHAICKAALKSVVPRSV